ncbi:hypothetical protein AOLI_G00259080 [Acnodon oligacanthus]
MATTHSSSSSSCCVLSEGFAELTRKAQRREKVEKEMTGKQVHSHFTTARRPPARHHGTSCRNGEKKTTAVRSPFDGPGLELLSEKAY